MLEETVRWTTRRATAFALRRDSGVSGASKGIGIPDRAFAGAAGTEAPDTFGVVAFSRYWRSIYTHMAERSNHL